MIGFSDNVVALSEDASSANTVEKCAEACAAVKTCLLFHYSVKDVKCALKEGTSVINTKKWHKQYVSYIKDPNACPGGFITTAPGTAPAVVASATTEAVCPEGAIANFKANADAQSSGEVIQTYAKDVLGEQKDAGRCAIKCLENNACTSFSFKDNEVENWLTCRLHAIVTKRDIAAPGWTFYQLNSELEGLDAPKCDITGALIDISKQTNNGQSCSANNEVIDALSSAMTSSTAWISSITTVLKEQGDLKTTLENDYVTVSKVTDEYVSKTDYLELTKVLCCGGSGCVCA